MRPIPFSAKRESVAGTEVITVRGELDWTNTKRLEKPLRAAVSSKRSRVLIDLTDCQFIDSAGSALLVRAWQQIRDEEGAGQNSIALCGLTGQVQRALKITGIASQFAVYADRSEALDQLPGGS